MAEQFELMRSILDGMCFTPGACSFSIGRSKSDCVPYALGLFRKMLPAAAHNFFQIFDGPGTTLSQVELILKGVDVPAASAEVRKLIGRYGQAARRLFELIEEGQFKGGFEDFSATGRILTGEVFLIPEARGALRFLKTVCKNPKEYALCSFIYLLKEGRDIPAAPYAASLFLNALLVSSGWYPVIIHGRDAPEFRVRMLEFERDGNADGVLHFFEQTLRRAGERHRRFSPGAAAKSGGSGSKTGSFGSKSGGSGSKSGGFASKPGDTGSNHGFV